MSTNRFVPGHKAYEDVRYRLEVVSPEMAQGFADTFVTGEKPTRAYEQKIAAYALAMSRRQWVLNGEPLIFSGGRLVSGLARCLACVKSGEPFPTVIVDGIPEDVLPTLDTHLKRTARDVLGINGEAYPVALVTACQVVTRYLNANDRTRFVMGRGSALTSQEIESLVEEDPRFKASADLVARYGVHKVISHGVATAAHYLMSLADPEGAELFMMMLGEDRPAPSDGPERDAARVLRARLVGIRDDERKGATPLTFRLALVAKAWNRRNGPSVLTPQALNFHGMCENKSLGNEAFPAFDGVPSDARIDIAKLVASHQGGEGPPVDHMMSVFDGGVTVSPMLITPAIAEEMLRLNGPFGGNGNRKVRKPHVEALSRDMRADRFMYNGQTVKLSEGGRILDGQHRLLACVASKTPFFTLVVRGLPDSVFSTYDTGRRQGLGLKLKKEGVAYAFQTSAAINSLWRIVNNVEHGEPTNVEGLEFARSHPGIAESARFVSGSKAVLQGTVSAPLHYLFGGKSKPQADQFFTQIAVGADLSVGDPVHTFRERVLADRRKFSAANVADTIRLCIRAWNARRERKVNVRLTAGGGPGYPRIV